MFVILLIFTLTSFTSSSYINDLNADRLKHIEYFDLSYTFSNDTIYFPGQKNFQLYKDKVNVRGPGYSYSSYSMSMSEHGGTHLDAPFHFNPDGWTVDKIPSRNLIDVPAVLIDVSKAVNQLMRPSEFLLEVSHILQHEIETNSIIPFGGVLLIYTGWSKFWPNRMKYLGSYNTSYGEESLNFPGISENVAKWLVNERHIVGIGLDTASIDPGFAKTYPAHVVMAQNQIYNLENVANLHLLLNVTKPNCVIHLFVMPLKIVGGTGAPTRILAYCRRTS